MASIDVGKVAPLALGGNVFGWTADEAVSFRLMDGFVAAGGQMIDTADSYSAWVPGHVGGESETVIGKWLKSSRKRDEVVIASKVGFLEGLAPEVVAKACDASLKRLGTDIDLYYLHTDDQKVPLADSLGAFDALVKAGKVRAIGLSNFTPGRIDEVMATCEAEGLTKPVALQPWYNLVERARYEDELEACVRKHDLAVFTYYSIANGFLAGKYRSKDDLSKSPRGLRNIAYLEGRGPKVLEAMDAIAGETGAPLATIALAWLGSRPTVTAPIASATSLAQLSELTASLTLELSEAQLAALDAASA
ncbi:aldo/keto reductase [Sphingomicrobium aestuariivivum]|uniref:aldo/keto reductase n=1 Tax=Sphingomicrobium aestuariivivum TaxID=1582356 RepID=UPI001FD6A08E|nr:aldo/keto reductase [Sphingomicrobium aestuariivivum]MCJ8191654.1 aldo/keto reductase [Sphingomicrobium aestuariivivum]